MTTTQNEKQNNAPRKSVISRAIKRTLKTDNFESLVIEIGFEEEIEWSTLSERQTKIDNWNTVLLQDFMKTSDRVLSELGLEQIKAYFPKTNAQTSEKYGSKQIPGLVNPAKVRNLDLEDLDSLDTIK